MLDSLINLVPTLLLPDFLLLFYFYAIISPLSYHTRCILCRIQRIQRSWDLRFLQSVFDYLLLFFRGELALMAEALLPIDRLSRWRVIAPCLIRCLTLLCPGTLVWRSQTSRSGRVPTRRLSAPSPVSSGLSWLSSTLQVKIWDR